MNQLQSEDKLMNSDSNYSTTATVSSRLASSNIKRKLQYILILFATFLFILLALSIHNFKALYADINPQELFLILRIIAFMLIFLIPLAGIYSLVTHYAVWAGWCKGLPQLADIFNSSSFDVDQQSCGVNDFVVYLDGIHQGAEDHPPRIRSFLDELESRLPPHVALVRGVYAYTVLPVSLDNDKGSSRLWQMLFAIQELHPNFLSKLIASILVEFNNIIKVGISSDSRYGPVVNYEYALKICSQLNHLGFKPNSGMRIILLGYSGGGGIAMATAEYLRRLAQSDVVLITLCGVFSANHELSKLASITTVVGTEDPVAAIGQIAYPGRLPILKNSRWNMANKTGKVNRSEVYGMTHNGDSGPFSDFNRSNVIDVILKQL